MESRAQRGGHFLASLLGAFVVTTVLVYSLSSASWTDFGSPVPVQTASGKSKHDACLLSLSRGHWELATGGCREAAGPQTPGVLHHCDNSTGYPRVWTWDTPEAECVPRSLVQADMAALFRGKRVALVGDSHLRKLAFFLRDVLANDAIRVAPESDKKEHKDIGMTVTSTDTRIEFYWRAEIRSTTAAVAEFLRRGEAPDLLICDASAHQAKWTRPGISP